MSPSHSVPASPHELLSLAESQWLFTDAEMLQTPSILDGMSPEKERESRSKGVNFILQVGIMLRLPQMTLATASLLLHRFFMRYSMVQIPNRINYHYYSMAATSLFLATKVEETGRKMKELVIACVRVAQKDPYKFVDEQDKEYWRWRDIILHNEDVLLEAVCFDLALEPPYKALRDFLKQFNEEENKKLRNAAWAFINDSYLTTLCLQFPSRAIAASALYAAAKHCQVLIPDSHQGHPWWDTIGIDIKNIKQACNHLAKVYQNAPLKDGRDQVVYECTPEDGDEPNWKTRAPNPFTRQDSGTKPSGSLKSESLKNNSYVEEENENLHHDSEMNSIHRDKRRRTDNGLSQPLSSKAQHTESQPQDMDDTQLEAQDVSEEGEVES
ncbi:MAG: hypothetical protein Q9167_006648 [Letrouitia subvulpina]